MMRKTKEKMALFNAEGKFCFWINNGPVIKNIKDLSEALRKIGEEKFRYHVNKEKNDFANWVGEVLKDTTLANKLKKIKTLEATIKAIDDRLKKYTD